MKTVAQAAKALRLSAIRVYKLLEQGRIRGAKRFGNVWIIPDKPVIHPPLQKQFRPKTGGKR